MKCVGSTDACLCQSPAHIVHSWPPNPCDLKQRCWLQSKNLSTVIKESYPLLAIRRHGLKIAPAWKNTLFRRSTCIPYSARAPQICPPFISPQDYDYSPISKSCQAIPDGFFIWSSRQKEASSQQKSYFHEQSLSDALRGTFSFNCGFLAAVKKTQNKCIYKRWGSVNFLYLQQNLRRSLFLSHQGIHFSSPSIAVVHEALSSNEY